MNQLSLGGRVRISASRSSFNCRIGRIVHITQPFVATEQMRSEVLRQLPVYEVRLDDGSYERCRGRDLEALPAGDTVTGLA